MDELGINICDFRSLLLSANEMENKEGQKLICTVACQQEGKEIHTSKKSSLQLQPLLRQLHLSVKVSQLIGWSVCQSVRWLIHLLVGPLVNQLVCQSIGLLVSQSVGQSVSRSGQSISWYVEKQHHQNSSGCSINSLVQLQLYHGASMIR